jgi:hypothetical protein
MQRQALPRMFIEQRQDAEAAAVVGFGLTPIVGQVKSVVLLVV